MDIQSEIPALQVLSLRCEHDVNPLGVESIPPRLSWQMESLVRDTHQVFYHIQVASSPDLLEASHPDRWDSGEVASSDSVLVPCGGREPQSRQRYFWRVRVGDNHGQRSAFSPIAWFEMGMLDDEYGWHAQWIARPDACLVSWEVPVLPAPALRKEFDLPSGPASARAYISGLGYYELYLNGQKVGDRVLDPVVTQYDRHVGYATLDVTEYLREGSNVAGVILGNGWYNCHTAEVWHFDKASWRDYPKLLLQIEVTMESGEMEHIVSDETWRVTDSPIRFDGLRNGETYDAREELSGWLTPGYDDSAWRPAAIVPEPGGQLFSQQTKPCAVIETLDAIYVREAQPGVFIFDFGQNIAGWAALQASAPAGTEVTLRYGERLDEDGRLDVKSIAIFIRSGDFQTDRYIFKGDGIETWEPRFTYHGFRYVEVSGLLEPVGSDTLRARVVHTAFDRIGNFSCSNDTLNRLQECTVWSYRGNWVGIPTDCPHREKNGWTGDAAVAAETGLYNFDATTAYTHWLKTLADTQRPSGQLPGIAPTAGWGYNWGNGPAWDSAFILIPWYLYLYRGDLRPLEEHFSGMKRYIELLWRLAPLGVVRWGLGDWCAPDANKTAPPELVTTAYAYGACRILARIAGVLGHEEEARDLQYSADCFRGAWRREFLRPDGHCVGDEQTSLACALYFDLLNPHERGPIAQRLQQAIEVTGGKLTFGMQGSKWTLRALSNAGMVDEASQLLLQPEFPGWVHCLEQGATTLWEEWHGESSRNHIMFGDISAWMFAYLAGIRPHPDHAGFKRFLIHPHLPAHLDSVRAEYHSPYGVIRSAWRRGECGRISLEVIVPVNTTTEIWLPTTNAGSIMESGMPIQQRMTIVPSDSSGIPVVTLGSGDYTFEIE